MISPKELKEYEALLPFYVNGTLNDQDRIRLDAALSVSEDLRASLEQEQAIRQQVHESIDSRTAQSDESIDARAALLNARTKVSDKPLGLVDSPEPTSGLANMLGILNPKRWHPAVALGLAIAIPAQAGAIAYQASRIASLKDENFKLASGPCKEETGSGQILLEVKDGVRFDALMTLIESEGLKLHAHAGLGMVQVKSDKTGAELTSQIERLRKSPLLSSVEPGA
jgi:hypothetical protein